jgi:hypothetical protein
MHWALSTCSNGELLLLMPSTWERAAPDAVARARLSPRWLPSNEQSGRATLLRLGCAVDSLKAYQVRADTFISRRLLPNCASA